MNSLKTIGFILIVWQTLAWMIGNPYTLPNTYSIIAEYPELLKDARFISSIGDTVFFLIKTWTILLMLLFLLILASVFSSTFRKLFKMLCVALQPTPTFAWLPVFILVFGVNEFSMTLLMIFATVWMVGLNLIVALEESISKWSKHCINLKLSLISSVIRVYLPSIRALFLANFQTCWNMSWRILVGIEVVFGTVGNHWGMGTYMTDAKDLMDTNTMYAMFFVIICIGVFTNNIFETILKRRHDEIQSN